MTLREATFLAAYYGVTGAYALAALPLLAARRSTAGLVRSNARAVRGLLRAVGGVAVTVEGREHLPDGPYILAAKHQSWGDGYVWLSAIDGLAPVIGAHVLKPDIVRRVALRAGAVVVDNDGPAAARGRALRAAVEAARVSGRPLLVFPEGAISEEDGHRAFRPGVFRLYEALGWPVVPAATDLGARWPLAEGLVLRPGPATARLLPPIPPGLGRTAFMARLEEAVVGETDRLRAGHGVEAGREGPPVHEHHR